MFDIRAVMKGVLIGLCLSGSARAGEPGGVDHLVPVNPYPSRSTHDYVMKRNALLGVDKFELDDDGHFIGGVLAVVIQEPFDSEKLLVFRRGTVTRVSPDRNLWYAMGDDEAPRGENPLIKVKIQCAAINLGEERTRRVAKLIETLLHETRYPAADADYVEDSTVYEFRLRSERLFGEATDEASGQAKLLVDIVDAIARIEVRPDGSISDNSFRALDRMCGDLESSIEKR